MAKGGDWVIGRDVDPGSPLTNFNDRGGDRGSYFIPKKSQLQNVSTQKSHYIFSTPKKFLSPVFAAQKIPPSLNYVSGAPGDVGNRTNFDVLFYTVTI